MWDVRKHGNSWHFSGRCGGLLLSVFHCIDILLAYKEKGMKHVNKIHILISTSKYKSVVLQ